MQFSVKNIVNTKVCHCAELITELQRRTEGEGIAPCFLNIDN